MGTVAQAAIQPRIVVLPFYTEEGQDPNNGGQSTQHYRRITRFINNQLKRHGFDVMNASAVVANEKEYNRMEERAREDSPLAAMEMCKKFGVDAVYIIWLNIKRTRTTDNLCKARARLEGEGYDSGGRDLGVALFNTFHMTKKDCDDAVAGVEVEVGDMVGRKLTAWAGNYSAGFARRHTHGGGGQLMQGVKKLKNQIEIRLDGGTEPAVVEIFSKVINTVNGVSEARCMGGNLVPDNPQASFQRWIVTIENTDPIRLQANVKRMIDRILDSGGSLTLKGVTYRYTPAETNLLMGFRAGSTSSRRIQFKFDRGLMRERELSGRHDPYKAQIE